MSARYTCHHHDTEHKTYSEIIMHVCGCDGTVHHACQPRPAPAGTPRPADWPAQIGWNIDKPHRYPARQLTPGKHS